MTDPRTALRQAVYYRVLATGAFIVGGAIAAAGLWLGLGEAVAVLATSFLQDGVVSRASAAANVPLTVVFLAVGVSVWQVGKSAAFYWTFTRALEEGTGAVGSGTDAAGSETGGGPAAAGATTDGGRSGNGDGGRSGTGDGASGG